MASDDSILSELGYNLDLWRNVPLPPDSTVRSDPFAYFRVRAATAQTPKGGDATRRLETLLRGTLPKAVMSVTDWEVSGKAPFLFNEHYVVKPASSESRFSWHRDADRQLARLVPKLKGESPQTVEDGTSKGGKRRRINDPAHDLEYANALAGIPYASTWLPLQTTSPSNGTLVLLPYGAKGHIDRQTSHSGTHLPALNPFLSLIICLEGQDLIIV